MMGCAPSQDLCRDSALNFAQRDLFQTVISAGCHSLTVRIVDMTKEAGLCTVHWPDLEREAVELGREVHEERSQFKTHFNKGKLVTEQVIRLDNGFPTTIDEKSEYDRKQEYNVRPLLCLGPCAPRPTTHLIARVVTGQMRKLAENGGFNIARKKDAVKLKPNAPCQCGSGKKQKKCCGMHAV